MIEHVQKISMDEVEGFVVSDEERFPLNGSIEITSYCNLNCIHCYLRNNCRQYIDKCDIERIVNEIVEAGTLNLTLTGGEPLSHPDFEDIYVFCKENGLNMTVMSNATLLKETHLKLFEKYPMQTFSTTMYGATRETYESITRIPGSYDRFILNIETLQDIGVPVEIKTILLRQNKHEILNIQEFCIKHNLRFRFSPELRIADQDDTDLDTMSLTPEEILSFDVLLPSRLSYYFNEAREPSSYPITQKRMAEGKAYLCNIGMHDFFITSDFKIHGCSRERIHGISLKETPFMDAWNKIGQIRDFSSQGIRCHQCEYIGQCRHCAAEMELWYGEYRPIPSVCRLAELRTKLINNIRKEVSR